MPNSECTPAKRPPPLCARSSEASSLPDPADTVEKTGEVALTGGSGEWDCRIVLHIDTRTGEVYRFFGHPMER